MSQQNPPILTGDRELNIALAKLEKKAIRKLLPKAGRQAAKRVRSEYQSRVPKDTGAMRDAVAVRVQRRKQKTATGGFVRRGGVLVTQAARDGGRRRIAIKRVTGEDIGARVFVDADRLKRESGKKKRGAKRNAAAASGRLFFYPATVELGDRKETGKRPLTKSLYDNEDPIRREWMQAMRRLVGL